MQWPSTQQQRQQLAHILTSENPVQDPVQFAEQCSAGAELAYENGLCVINNTVAVQQTLVANHNNKLVRNVAPMHMTLLVLHVLWHGFAGQAAVIASYVQSKDATVPYWHTLQGYTAWILSPPAAIVTAVHIGRPDLQVVAMTCYMQWLRLVKNPRLIADALAILTETPLRLNSWTPLWQLIKRRMLSEGVQVAVYFKDDNLLSCHKSARPSIRLNNCANVFMAKCDVVCMLLRLLWDPTHGFAGKELPPHAPHNFAALQEAQPYLFNCNVKPPRVAFDELLPITVADN